MSKSSREVMANKNEYFFPIPFFILYRALGGLLGLRGYYGKSGTIGDLL